MENSIANNLKWAKKEVRIGDICTLIKRGVSPSYIDIGGVLVLNQRCVREQRIILDAARRNNVQLKKVPSDRYLQLGDVLINSTGVGTLGRVAQIKELNEKTTVDSHVTIVRPADGFINLDFWGWLMRYNEPFFEQLGEGSTGQTELAPNRIAEFRVEIPESLSVQKTIAHILGSLDDKIELNRRMNQTLEQMAQALFKSWFVDFDPVIDNALAAGNPIPDELQERAQARQALGNNRKPLPVHVQQLFPSEFEFSEVLEKWVPWGWRVGKISDVAEVKTGYPFKSIEYSEGEGVKVVRGENVSRGFLRWDTLKSWDKSVEGLENYWIKEFDVVVGMDGSRIGQNKSLVHKHEVPMLLAQRVACLTARKDYGVSFLCQLILSAQFESYIELVKTGTSIPHMSLNQIKNYPVILPNAKAACEYSLTLSDFLNKIGNCKKQIETLTQQRDTLLPKLISGELRLPEAEKLISRC